MSRRPQSTQGALLPASAANGACFAYPPGPGLPTGSRVPRGDPGLRRSPVAVVRSRVSQAESRKGDSIADSLPAADVEDHLDGATGPIRGRPKGFFCSLERVAVGDQRVGDGPVRGERGGRLLKGASGASALVGV